MREIILPNVQSRGSHLAFRNAYRHTATEVQMNRLMRERVRMSWHHPGRNEKPQFRSVAVGVLSIHRYYILAWACNTGWQRCGYKNESIFLFLLESLDSEWHFLAGYFISKPTFKEGQFRNRWAVCGHFSTNMISYDPEKVCKDSRKKNLFLSCFIFNIPENFGFGRANTSVVLLGNVWWCVKNT